MGKSVSDFKDGRNDLYRDRISNVLTTTRGTDWSYSGSGSPTVGPLYAAGSLSRCVDQNHPLFHRAMRMRNKDLRARYRKMRNLDMGGPFAKESSTLSMPTRVSVKKDYPFDVHKGYEGVYFPSNAYKLLMSQAATTGRLPAIPSELGISRAELWGLGSTAIARSIPDVPDFSLFRMIGELRAGLPKIPLKALAKEKKLRNVGGEYLNVQFGILPTISDLQNFLEALQNPRLRASLDHQIDEEHRVRKTLEKSNSSSTRVLTSSESKTATGLVGQTGTVTTTSSVRIWSSCSFGYYQFHDLKRLLDELDVTLGGIGAVPTAIDLWNLLPWSWLVDWFANFNHVATNLSYLGRDGLYLQRGYLMAHYEEREITANRGLLYDVPFETVGTRTTERKYRVKASPFGFGYTWKDFDPFQLSILGALGVSRMRF